MNRNLQPPTPKVSALNIVAPINKGGTGGKNVIEAAANFGAINIGALGAASGLAKAGSDGKVQTDQYPAIAVVGATLNGPAQVSINQTVTYQITNFDSLTPYTVSVDQGTVSIVNDVITYVAPGAPVAVNLTVNGKVFAIAVGQIRPVAPVLSLSTTGNSTSANVAMSGSAFAMSSGSATHINSDWELYSDVSLTNLVVSTLADSTNKTGWTANGLALGTTYYGRCRYRANNNQVSDWSTTVSITTAGIYYPKTEEAKFNAGADGMTNGYYASDVSIDETGTRVVVGSYRLTVGAQTQAGLVHVYVRTGTTWALEQRITCPDTGSNQFGYTVSVSNSGTRFIASARVYGGTAQGAAYIFVRSGSTWTLEQRVRSDVVKNNEYYGTSVDINQDDTYAAVGGSGSGTTSFVYIYTRSGSVWTQQAKLNPSDNSSSWVFGAKISLTQDATRVFATAAGATNGASSTTGAVYVYSRSGVTWTQEAKVIPTSTDVTSFGTNSIGVNLDGSKFVVGVSNENSFAGSAYVFSRSGVTWTEEAKILPNDPLATTYFGQAVSLSNQGDRLSVGAGVGGNGTTGKGSVYTFSKINGVWTQSARTYASDSFAGDRYGSAVDISRDGTRIVVGAYAAPQASFTSAGAVYIIS